MSEDTHPKCLALTFKGVNSKRSERETSQCTRYALDNSRFCANHQNLHELTDEQFKNNTKICRQCRKHKYFTDMSYKVCDDDLKRGVINRTKMREHKIVYDPCVICGFTGGSERHFPNYCNKHMTDGYKADIESRGMKWCKGIIRGCPNPELPKNYPYENCEYCRQKELDQDHVRSNIKLMTATEYIKSVANPVKVLTDGGKLVVDQRSEFDCIYPISGNYYKICSHPKHHCQHPLIDFLTTTGVDYYNQHIANGDDISNIISYLKAHYMITRQCREILERQKAQDIKRQCNYNDPQLSEKRRDAADYIELDTESKKVYRNTHPDIDVRAYRGAIKSSSRKACECKRAGTKRGIAYELTPDETQQIINSKCFYCNHKPPDCQLNGIDRLDSKRQYELDNCVACCSMCNYMKACYDPLVFINMCEHILTYLLKIDGRLYPQLFKDFNSTCSVDKLYESYKISANKRQYEWSLTIDQFTNIVKQPCYLCGKKSGENHTNGIDRFYNAVGYIITNSLPCCGNCNYIKRDYDYNSLTTKLMEIHANRNAILEKLKSLKWTLSTECESTTTSMDAPVSSDDHVKEDQPVQIDSSMANISKVSADEVSNRESIKPQSVTQTPSIGAKIKIQIVRKQHVNEIPVKQSVYKTSDEQREYERVRKREYRARKKLETQQTVKDKQ